MDEGAIKSFKGYFRLKIARYLIKWVADNEFGDAVNSSAVMFYQACQMAISPWDQLEKSTISNCILHYGFYKAKCIFKTIDPEYNLHSEFDKIKTQFNSVIIEESINIDT